MPFTFITPDMEELEIIYDYDPGEPDTRSLPGSPAVVEVRSVTMNGHPVGVAPDMMYLIEKACVKDYIENMG